MSYKTNTRIVLKNSNKDKIGTIFIEIVFYHKITKGKVRRYVSTEQKLNINDINKSKIKQVDKTKAIRQIVEKKIFEVNEKLRNLKLEHNELSPAIYDQSNITNEYERYTIFELFDEFLKYQEAEHEPLTVKKHETFKKLLIEYKINRKIKTLFLKDIDQKFFKDFTKFLKRSKKHAPPTVNKYQGCLKAFMEYLTEEHELNQNAVHRSFKTESKKRSGGSKVVLLKEHIEKLKNWKTENKRYELVRDLFMFQILTGIRFSDLVNVNKSYVINNSLSFDMYKVNRRVTIPLHPYALRILTKYNFDLGDKCKTLQKYNKDIKEVCKQAGLTDKIRSLKIKLNRKVKEEDELWQMVSTHVGRTTFITNCLISGISPFIVMEYTGHTKIDTLAEYMRIAGTMTQDAFKKFENYLRF
jgi:site-specific recombinase XerD